jgi:hypothetical protein
MRRTLVAAFAALLCSSPAFAGQIVTLDKDNWNLVPGGKEVDAIYGDYLLKNDKVVAVIASNLWNRQLNLRISGAQGSVVDFALLSSNNDQLTVFHPHAYVGEGPAADRVEVVKADGAEVALRVMKKATAKDPVETVTDYTLKDGDQHLTIVTRRKNTGDKPAKVRLTDRLFHEKPADFSNRGNTSSHSRSIATSVCRMRWFGRTASRCRCRPVRRPRGPHQAWSTIPTRSRREPVPAGLRLHRGRNWC